MPNTQKQLNLDDFHSSPPLFINYSNATNLFDRGSLSSILRLSSARTTEKNDNETEDLVDETEKMALSSTSSPVPPVVVEVDRRSMGSVASNASSIEKVRKQSLS